ncbi:MAG TPA: hypothetical protein VGO31_10585 [Microbacteriaceae bacterium]|jgi:hypothetical protein|nr:hypothetical protein [Microbacteriaceae bacterium]
MGQREQSVKRRLGLVIGVALLLAVAAAGGALSAAGGKARITFITANVSPGGVLTIKASAPTGARCAVVLLRSAHPTAQLPSHSLPSGRTSWTYRLPVSAKLGAWKAALTCSKGGAVSAPFTVGAPPVAPAQISVVKSGFSAEAFDSQTILRCGVQLQNTSTVSDARGLVVTVTFVDTQGRSLTHDEIDLTVIPAGQTFYASCLTISNVTLSVASVQVTVKVGNSVAKRAQLPAVSGLNLTPDEYGSTQTLAGNLTSPYTKAMPEDAQIEAVYFDASGNIIGGDRTRAGASVQPGATVGFSFDYLDANVASAQVSVDPCGVAAILGDCEVP